MRALVLSGGGARGAYQVGAIKHLLGDLHINYDVFCGISVGALNASYLSMFPAGHEQDAIAGLAAVWSGVDNDRIFKNWCPFGKLSLLWKPSIYDSQPLQDLVSSILDRQLLSSSNKILRVGAVSLNTNEYRVWSEKDPDIVKAVIASSAFPAMFKPVEIDGQMWTDGGVREVTPLREAINLGATTIDVVTCSPSHETTIRTDKKLNVVDVVPRVIEAMSAEIVSNDLMSCEDLVDIRILSPSRTLLNNPLDFDPTKIEENMKLGYEEALNLDWE